VSDDSRVGDRKTISSLRIRLKYPDTETFIQKYSSNISRGGIFISSKSPKPVGTKLRFEFLLTDDASTSLIRGEGQVIWVREQDKPGMGLKFLQIDPDSQAIVNRALAYRAKMEQPAPEPRWPEEHSDPSEVSKLSFPRWTNDTDAIKLDPPPPDPEPQPRPARKSVPPPIPSAAKKPAPGAVLPVKVEAPPVDMSALDALIREAGLDDAQVQRALDRPLPKGDFDEELEALRAPLEPPTADIAEALIAIESYFLKRA
jgi:uncharacterized protein (TIGR02266 family)